MSYKSKTDVPEWMIRDMKANLRHMGMGQVLTSSMCDPTSVSNAFRTRLVGAMSAGTQAAIVGGAIAGAVGSVTAGGSKKAPLMGAIAGAAIGWVANYVWTATHRA